MNTRRKRHRVSSSPSSSSSASYDCPLIKNENYKRKNVDGEVDVDDSQGQCCHTLETLPPEVLGMILRLLPLDDVAGSIRLVSRRCSTIASTVLNGAFLAAGIRLESTMSHVEKTMTRATTDSDLLAWSRAFNVLELIRSQYKMLKAVTWRYTHPRKAANLNRVCFYAGSLLDELNSILDIARIRPRALLTPASAANAGNNNNSNNDNGRDDNRAGIRYEEIVAVATAASPRLVSFVALCKRFMNYFEKVTECRFNRSALVSGCKAVDVLDCLAVGREVTGFRISSDRITTIAVPRSSHNVGRIGGSIVTMRLTYVLRRAWFTCLQVPCAPDENSWREDQRFMYLRLRRLVGSVNEHHFEKVHFERDSLLRTSSVIAGQRAAAVARLGVDYQPPRPPAASTYSGYGVYAGRFFYYGNMNKYAYESKFKDLTNIGEEGGGDLSDESGHDDEDESERRNNSATSKRGPPAFDLVIRVELRCSIDLAPLAVVSSFGTSELDDEQSVSGGSCNFLQETNNSQENSELYLKLNITCAASAANRLPGNFTWEQRGVDHSRYKRRQLRFSH